mgnify:CR=1 FL=1
MKKNYPDILIRDIVNRLMINNITFGECRVEYSYISYKKIDGERTFTVPFIENDHGEVRSVWFTKQEDKKLTFIQLMEFELYGKEDLI